MSAKVLSWRRREISDMLAPAPDVMRLTRSVSRPPSSGSFCGGGGGAGGLGGGGTGGFGGSAGGFGGAGLGGSVGTFCAKTDAGGGATGFGTGASPGSFAFGSGARGSGICNFNSSSSGFGPPDAFSSLPGDGWEAR